VPHITAGMLDALTGTLEGGAAAAVAPDRLLGRRKRELPNLLGDTEKAHEGCQIGSYPFFREGRVGANFVIRSTDAHRCSTIVRRGFEVLGLPDWVMTASMAAFELPPTVHPVVNRPREQEAGRNEILHSLCQSDRARAAILPTSRLCRSCTVATCRL
jgi:hypothetical protein